MSAIKLDYVDYYICDVEADKTGNEAAWGNGATVWVLATNQYYDVVGGAFVAKTTVQAITTGTLAQFAATTSAQLAGVISDETGSGSLVFATSPTLVTPALGTPSSGTLTNCTGLPSTAITGTLGADHGGTGVANNASSTLTISGNFATTLTVSNTTSVTLPTSGTLSTLAGTETLTNKKLVDNSVTFVDDGDATKQLAFQCSGITTGTTRTVTMPDFSGSMALTNGTLVAGRVLYWTSTGLQDTTGLGWDNTNQALFLPVGSAANPSLRLGAFQSGFYIDTASAVTTIGVTINGTARFDITNSAIVSSTNGSFSLKMNSAGTASLPTYSFANDTDTGMYSDAANTIKFANGGAQFQTFDSSGRAFFGGTTAPAAFVTIAAGTTSIAPLQFTSGTSLTSAVAGSMEFTTDDLFFTITTGTARKRLLMADPVGGLTSGRVPFATTNGRLTDDSDLTFATDTLTCTIYAVGTRIEPVSNDGAPLGSTTKQFSDLFLAEGGVINWDNGDATITQTADDITIAGITTFGVGTSTAVTLGTIELGAASDTTIARVSAGVVSIEGVTIATSSNTLTLTNKTIGVTQLNGSANTMAVNNTGGTANYTETTYNANAVATYSSSITWTGTTAPSGTTNHQWWWKQVGSLVTITISLNYQTAGTANTAVKMVVPAGPPSPVAISGTTTNDKVASGFGWIDTATTGGPGASRVYMINDGAGAYSINITAASQSAKVALATVTYSTN